MIKEKLFCMGADRPAADIVKDLLAEMDRQHNEGIVDGGEGPFPMTCIDSKAVWNWLTA